MDVCEGRLDPEWRRSRRGDGLSVGPPRLAPAPPFHVVLPLEAAKHSPPELRPPAAMHMTSQSQEALDGVFIFFLTIFFF